MNPRHPRWLAIATLLAALAATFALLVLGEPWSMATPPLAPL